MSKKPERLAVFSASRSQSNPSKTVWKKVGAAWEGPDGSLCLLLDDLPPDGKLKVRAQPPKRRRSRRADNE